MVFGLACFLCLCCTTVCTANCILEEMTNLLHIKLMQLSCRLAQVALHVPAADYEVYAGEELKVVDSEQYDADDVGSLFGSPGSSSRHETGFLGTALMGAQPEVTLQ